MQSRVIDIDELLSEGFDPRAYVSPDRASAYDYAENLIGKDEFVSEIALQELIRKSGARNRNDISARRTMLSAQVGEGTAFDILRRIREGDMSKQAQDRIAELREALVDGAITTEEFDKRVDALRPFLKAAKPMDIRSIPLPAGVTQELRRGAPLLPNHDVEAGLYAGLEPELLAKALVVGAARVSAAVLSRGIDIFYPQEKYSPPEITPERLPLERGGTPDALGTMMPGTISGPSILAQEAALMPPQSAKKYVQAVLEGDTARQDKYDRLYLSAARAREREVVSLRDWFLSLAPEKWSWEVDQAAKGPLFDFNAESANAWMATIGAQIPVIGASVLGAAVGSVVGPPGAVAGGFAPMALMEADDFYTSATGIGIDADIARKYAKIYGVGSGAIEYAQVLWIGTAFKPQTKVLSAKASALVVKALKEVGGIAWEGAEEFGQNELSTWLLQKAADEHNLSHPKDNIKAPKLGEGGLRAFATGAGVAGVLRMTGHTTGLIGQVRAEEKIEAARQRGETTPVTRISRIVPTGRIVARVDPLAMGEAVVEAKPEKVEQAAPAKPAKPLTLPQLRKKAAGLNLDISDLNELTGKERRDAIQARIDEAAAKRPLLERGTKPLTPEEAFTLQQTEATFAATESLPVHPNLYIGNVTARMKGVFAEAIGVAPERIGGFTEKGWPVKRTRIELTAGEAREELFRLERSLQERLDKNQINTHHDMAMANADWGDIKELRKVLGLPAVPRPFRVIKEPGTKIVTIENVKERIAKTVTPSAGDIVETTQIDRLNNVIRRIVRATKEGYKLGKKELRALYAELQYLRKQRQLRQKLVDKIQAEPSDAIDFFYREAIQKIQAAIDFDVTSEDKKAAKDSLRQLIERNPDKADEIPAGILETLDKKDVSALSYNNLLAINQELDRLRGLGRLKSKLFKDRRTKELAAQTNTILGNLKKAKGVLVPAVKGIRYALRSFNLRPPRIFDMIDGGKDWKGEAYNFFYWQTNENTNAEITNVHARQTEGMGRMRDLGITLRRLGHKRTIGDLTLTLDEMLSVYAGWKNPASQAALRYGGLAQKVKGKETYVEVTDALYGQIENALTEAEKAWADTIITEYAEHYDPMRNTTIRVENRDPGYEVNYTKMRRKNVDYKTIEEEIKAEFELRHYFRRSGPHKGFTIARKDIPPKFQSPIELGLTRIWMGEVRKQEHYINHAEHLKDMRAVAENEDFRQMVSDKFGKPVLTFIDKYITKIARPDVYKALEDWERVSSLLRRHVAIAYIGFRYLSIAKQLPQMMMFWAHSSIGDMLTATKDTIFHPRRSFEMALNIHPQLRHQSIEREMEEMHNVDAAGYGKALNMIGRAGMYGLFAVDRATRVIGLNAMYNKAIRDGLSPTEAARKASGTILRVQEASGAKDLARLYTSHELLNWFTMFTNELNQIFNIATYDIPTTWRNGHYRQAARSAIGLSAMAFLIWMIEHGEFPDEPEDFKEALEDQALSSIPLFGTAAASRLKGWAPNAPAPLQAASAVIGAAKYLEKGEYEKAAIELVEPTMVLFGLPYQAPKEIYELIEDEE